MRRPAQLSLTPRTKEQIECSVLSWRVLSRNEPERIFVWSAIDEIKAEKKLWMRQDLILKHFYLLSEFRNVIDVHWASIYPLNDWGSKCWWWSQQIATLLTDVVHEIVLHSYNEHLVIRWRSQVTGPSHCITSESIVAQALWYWSRAPTMEAWEMRRYDATKWI